MVRYTTPALALLVALSSSSSSAAAFSPRTITTSSTRVSLGRRNVSSTRTIEQFDNNDNDNTNTNNKKMNHASIQEMGAAFVSDAFDTENDEDSKAIELKKQMVRERTGNNNYATTVHLDTKSSTLGVTLCQVFPNHVVSNQHLNLDTMDYQTLVVPIEEEEENKESLSIAELKERTNAQFRGVMVSSVQQGSQGWEAGIRPGDVVSATSATMGEALWPKSTLEGIRSAIVSRKVMSSSLAMRLTRTTSRAQIDNQYELMLERPIGFEIQEDRDGYVVVTGFNKNVSRLVSKAVQVGDRIVAVGSSFGESMWPVSTVEGVISAVTGRLPGKGINVRFERPQELLQQMEQQQQERTTATSAAKDATTSAVQSTATTTTAEQVAKPVDAMSPEKRKELLQRCRDVLKRYNSDNQNSKADFVGKFSVPALVAEKVIDAVASASTSFDAVTLSMVMHAFLSCRQPDDAIRIFEAAVGVAGDGSEANSNVVIHGKEQGTLVTNPQGLDLYTAASLLRAHSLKGDLAKSKRVLAALDGKSGIKVDGKTVASWPGTGVDGSMVPDTMCYNAVLSAAANADTESSLADLNLIFNKMRNTESEPGHLPIKNDVSFNTVISALSKAGHTDEAFELFNTMKRLGIKPDKFTYTSLVKACDRAMDMQELLYDMREKNVQPDIVTYNTIIRTLCERGQWYDAKNLITDMETQGLTPNSMTYGFLMTGLYKAKKYNACITLFETACRDLRTTELTQNVHLYTTATAAAAKLRNHEKAFDLIHRMTAAGVKPNLKTLTALMDSCISSGNAGLAVMMYKKMEKPDGIAISMGIEAMCQEGLFSDVESLLRQQWQQRRSAMSGKQLMQGHVRLLQSTLEQGDLQFARQAFTSFLGMGFIPSKRMLHLVMEALDLLPPRNRGTTKPVPDDHFDFLLFVLDSLQGRNLAIDATFYNRLLLCGSRIGGLRRKLCSLMAESRMVSDDESLLCDEDEAVCTVGGWEDLLYNYDSYKQDPAKLQLPLLSVNMAKNQVRPVLMAEQEVTYNTRNSKAKKDRKTPVLSS